MLTTTPRSIRNPIRVLALRRELFVRISAIREPNPASGILNIRTTGVVRDSKTEARII